MIGRALARQAWRIGSASALVDDVFADQTRAARLAGVPGEIRRDDGRPIAFAAPRPARCRPRRPRGPRRVRGLGRWRRIVIDPISFAAAQRAYDNMEPPDYDDEPPRRRRRGIADDGPDDADTRSDAELDRDASEAENRWRGDRW